MPLALENGKVASWSVRKIVVVGPGIVGMPMAAMLAHARVREGSSEPARVVVLQRASPTSGWKVDAINAGRSPIGGIEPALDHVVATSVAAGLLSASHDYAEARDADVILVCVQTDKSGFGPDYGPLFEALGGIVTALRNKPAGNVPLIIFESTLAPSSMATLVRDHFARSGLEEGRDVLLGNSPNRVMPGRLVERVADSDKIVAGLHPETPRLIQRIYSRVVTAGTLYPTNSMTAEVVKTLENAYRDVRIAYAAEVCRFCDEADVDFYQVRDAVNAQVSQVDKASSDPNAVPSGGLLVPTTGVGGHCLPKDGILLWWRRLESGVDPARSLILESRKINDDSPSELIRIAERKFGPVAGRAVALLGTAYRFDSEDTRNSPTLSLARLLLARGCRVSIHDPYVKPDDQNLKRFGLDSLFTNDLGHALDGAELAFLCTGHRVYRDSARQVLSAVPSLRGVVDGSNLFHARDFSGKVGYTGMGRGQRKPPAALIDDVRVGFEAMERGMGNEVQELVEFLNANYASTDFNRVDFEMVQKLAGTCVTGCAIVDFGPVSVQEPGSDFRSRLVELARAADDASLV